MSRAALCGRGVLSWCSAAGVDLLCCAAQRSAAWHSMAWHGVMCPGRRLRVDRLHGREGDKSWPCRLRGRATCSALAPTFTDATRQSPSPANRCTTTTTTMTTTTIRESHTQQRRHGRCSCTPHSQPAPARAVIRLMGCSGGLWLYHDYRTRSARDAQGR